MASVAGLDQTFIFPEYNLFVSFFSGILQICIPAFLFDQLTQSGTERLDTFFLKYYAKGIKPPHEVREGFPKILHIK